MQASYYLEAMDKEPDLQKVLIVADRLKEEESLCYDIFRELTSDAEYAAYKVIFCIRTISKTVRESYQKMDNVTMEEYGSREFAECLAAAGIIISSTDLPVYYMRRNGQQFVHIPGGQGQRSFSQMLNASVVVSNKAECKSQCDNKRLLGIWDGIIVEEHGETRKEFVHKLLFAVLFQEWEQLPAGICRKEQERQRLLFVMDPQRQDGLMWKRMEALLNQLDESRYDVSILMTQEDCYPASERAKGIRLPVRILFCEGGPCYLSKDPEAEWRRLFSEAAFFSVYAIAPLESEWYKLCSVAPAEKVMLLAGRAPKSMAEYTAAQRLDKTVVFGLSAYLAFLESGEVEERKLELFDSEYCLLRSGEKFASVWMDGCEYLECGTRKESCGTEQACYIRAPSLRRQSLFLSIRRLERGQQIAVILALEEQLEKDSMIELYVEASAGLFYLLNRERMYGLSEEIVTVELLERLDSILTLTNDRDYKYSFIAALIKKPYGNAVIGRKEAPLLAAKKAEALVWSKGAYEAVRDEGIYLQYQKEEMGKLF